MSEIDASGEAFEVMSETCLTNRLPFYLRLYARNVANFCMLLLLCSCGLFSRTRCDELKYADLYEISARRALPGQPSGLKPGEPLGSNLIISKKKPFSFKELRPNYFKILFRSPDRYARYYTELAWYDAADKTYNQKFLYITRCGDVVDSSGFSDFGE